MHRSVSHHRPRHTGALRRGLAGVRRALNEFLLVPICIIAGFVALAALTFALDRGDVQWLAPLRGALQGAIFGDADATAELLGTLTGGLFTVTSITVSLLLIALQQAASALTHQVYDQFLRNWRNQVYFGFFVGVSVYAMVTLASAVPLNPVFGASVALLATVFALLLLLALFYTTVDQMRPTVIIEAIHKHTLDARRKQLTLLRRTRRTPRTPRPRDVGNRAPSVSLPVHAAAHGFVTAVDFDAIEAACRRAGGEVEVVLRVCLGDYVVFGQHLADVVADTERAALEVAAVLEDALRREAERDFANDPLDGIDELETIGWTSISSAQSDADAGVLTIYSLRDILARWSADTPPAPSDDTAPVVYVDNVLPRVIAALESLAVSASESMQHQSLAQVLRSFELSFERLSAPLQAQVEDVVLRMLSSLGDHVLTMELQAALNGLAACLHRAGRDPSAATVRTATEALATSIGKLGSRATRGTIDDA